MKMKINNSIRPWLSAAVVLAPLACAGCGGGSSYDYDFGSRFIPGESSVAYGGQVVRQLLIVDLGTRIAQLDAAAAGTTWNDPGGAAEPASALALFAGVLEPYFRNGSAPVASLDAAAILLTPVPAADQTTYGAISTGRRLSDKIAGADSGNPYYVDFTTSFVGITAATTFDGPAGTPPVTGWNATALVDAWLQGVSANAYAARSGTTRQVSSLGALIDLPPSVDTSGRDYRQLLEKFLLGAVAFSQLADDYLDDANVGAGLNSPNTQDGTNPYTVLEHAWDEGFGYFGATRDYAHLDDATIAAQVSDIDGSGTTDFRSEYAFGFARLAALRDTASCPSAKTDFTRTIGEAFVDGRAIIDRAGTTLTAQEQAELGALRDVIVSNLEQVIAATAIHYLNEVVNEEYANPQSFDFVDLAKDWSQMKAYLLALQFNPRSPFAHTVSSPNAQFLQIHQLLGDAPELDAASIPAYQTDLAMVRTILANAYGFAQANVAGEGTCEGF